MKDVLDILELEVKIRIDRRLRGSTVKKIDDNTYAVSPEGYRAILIKRGKFEEERVLKDGKWVTTKLEI